MSQPALGVCSWSLKVRSVPELESLMEEVGATVAQVALGDPNHATWQEGAGLVQALRQSSIEITATMIGYPGEDYTSPATIQATGGFGNPETRQSCLGIFRHAVNQTAELGVPIIVSHAGFIPEPGEEGRDAFVDCIGEAAEFAARRGVVFAMETGQETADLLRLTLDEIGMDSLKVNFDPANMILYNMGDPIRAVRALGNHIVSVHAKDARPPPEDGVWGEEVPLGEGNVGIPAFLEALGEVGYRGPLAVEREAGNQQERIRDIGAGVELLRSLVSTT